MIPRRFVTEYPERCLALLEMMEPAARDKDLLASFALLAAASVLVIPFERLRGDHPMSSGTGLAKALRKAERMPWVSAPFWNGCEITGWHFSRIVNDPNDVARWEDEHGTPSMSSQSNTIVRRKTKDVLRVLRNALAHGNIVYLNERGFEAPGTPVHYLAFLSRYEEDAMLQEGATTFRLVAVTAEDFLTFLRAWATWLVSLPADYSLAAA